MSKQLVLAGLRKTETFGERCRLRFEPKCSLVIYASEYVFNFHSNPKELEFWGNDVKNKYTTVETIENRVRLFICEFFSLFYFSPYLHPGNVILLNLSDVVKGSG